VVADGEFVVAGGDGPVLLEPGDRPLDDVALPVALQVDHGRPATPSATPSTGGLLVGPLRDGVSDPPLAQQPTTGCVAVAAVGDEMGWSFARATQGRPGHSDGVQQRSQLGALMTLAGGDQHGQRPAAAITSQVDLGGEPTPAAAQCLVSLSSRP
jgi:hypothetical protein